MNDASASRSVREPQGWHEDRPRKPLRKDRDFIPLFDAPKAPEARSWVLIVLSVITLIALTMHFRQDDVEVQDIAASDNVVIQSRQAATLMRVEREDSVLGPMRELATSPGPTRRVATTWAALDRGDGTRSLIALSIMARIPDQVADGAPLGAPATLDPLLIQAFMYPLEISEEERQQIEDEIGWPAQLLFARDLPDEDPVKHKLYSDAKVTSYFATGIVVFGLIAAAFGSLWGMRFLMGVRRKEFLFALEPPIASGSIYLEAFAVYLLCFAIGRLSGLLMDDRGLLIAVLAQVGGSVLGVFWPALRGVPVRAMARDLGFHRGAGWLLELRAGLVGYATVLPLFGAGVVVMVLLRFGFQAAGIELHAPLHPDMVGLGSSSLSYRLLLLGSAAVFAPIFEELMFRGALFRGLRARWGFGASSLWMALIFAAIHPQGLLAVPPLAALAIGFAALREWRSSLIAPTLAHAIHNATLVVLSSILLT